MARPCIFDTPMTPAERMRRHRRNKREGVPLKSEFGNVTRHIAKVAGLSERHTYYIAAVRRDGVEGWLVPEIIDPPARTSIRWIAEVCKMATPEIQRDLIRMIKKHGKKRAYTVWRCAKREAEAAPSS